MLVNWVKSNNRIGYFIENNLSEARLNGSFLLKAQFDTFNTALKNPLKYNLMFLEYKTIPLSIRNYKNRVFWE